jgi:hypothetical protein
MGALRKNEARDIPQREVLESFIFLVRNEIKIKAPESKRARAGLCNTIFMEDDLGNESSNVIPLYTDKKILSKGAANMFILGYRGITSDDALAKMLQSLTQVEYESLCHKVAEDLLS